MPSQYQRQSKLPAKLAPNLVQSYEAEVVEGIEEIAREELISAVGKNAQANKRYAGKIQFEYANNPHDLFRLQTISAVYRVIKFPVPRPRALLGHEHLHNLLKQIEYVRSRHPVKAFQTLHIDAAGSESSVMNRLKVELAQHTKLAVDNEAGDLLIRLRRPLDGSEGWEALIRLTPRPLATRSWRVCNYEGALNATVAHAMILLTKPTENDNFLNIACGSGTFLVERLAVDDAAQIIGCDFSDAALTCTRQNLLAGKVGHQAQLLHTDARQLPIASSSIDALCADLPFGQLSGSPDENRSLYPRLLQEAARVAKRGAIFTVLTHQIRLMEAVLSDQRAWATEDTFKITLKGLHPRVYTLRRQ